MKEKWIASEISHALIHQVFSRGAYAKAVADYTLSHDPSGDYARRAQFSALEVATMQADGVLDEGAVYAHKSGRVFVVRRGELRERKHGKANPTHKRRA